MIGTRYFASALAFFGIATAQAQTQVPNVFQSGQPAQAAEVNENFDTLESAIDQNTWPAHKGPKDLRDQRDPKGPRDLRDLRDRLELTCLPRLQR
jgi:hypothetical protein